MARSSQKNEHGGGVMVRIKVYCFRGENGPKKTEKYSDFPEEVLGQYIFSG